MTEDTQSNAPPTAGSAAQRRVMLAWLALAWERLWARLWIVAVLLGVAAIVVLIDVLPSLHWAVHIFIVIAAAVGVGAVAWRRLSDFTWPTRGEARARLETTSPVTHRPLTTVEDTLVAGASAIQEWMWRMHQARARDDLDRLRVKGPAPGVAGRDRFALRAAVILALFVAVLGGWSDLTKRVSRGILPSFGGDTSHVGIKLWITPPAYTNLSPTYVELPTPEGAKQPDVLNIPEGSKALAIITGTPSDTALAFDAAVVPLQKLADETQRGEVDVKPAKRVEIRQGTRVLAGWPAKWIEDKPPQIALPTPPSEASRWKLRIDYKAADDYGIESVTGRMSKAGEGAGEPFDFPVDLPPGAGLDFAQSAQVDLAAHPLAGQKVILQLIVKDYAGKTGTSAKVEAQLPERVFVHPVAKELVKWRKELMAKPKETASQALEAVTRILQHPESFGGEPLVHLTLATTKYRLANEPAADAGKTPADLMWHAAVRIEDGSLVSAERRLADAEQALKEAIERGAPPEEIKRRLAELKQAAAEYAKAKGAKDPKNSFAQSDKSMSDLEKAMDQVRQMSEMGATDAAKEAMQALRDQLEKMRDGGDKQADASKNPDVKKSEELLKEMRELTKKQSDLMNESFDKARKQAQSNKQDGDNQKQASKGGDDKTKQGKGDKQVESKGSDAGIAKAGDPKGDASMLGATGAASNQGDFSGNGEPTPGSPESKEAAASAAKEEALRKKFKEIMDKLEQMGVEKPENTNETEHAMEDARDSVRAAQWKEGAEGMSKAVSKLTQSMAEAEEKLMQQLLDKGLGGIMRSATPGQLRYSPLGSADGRHGEKIIVPTDPDKQGMSQRVRVILDEIRKRAADRTRPEEEQDYLQRLKKQF